MAGGNGKGNGKAATGTVLWVQAAGSPAEQMVVEESAKAFGLATRFCDASVFNDVLRASQAQIVCMEIGADSQEAIKRIAELHAAVPHIVILAAAVSPSLDTLRAVLSAGASDFISLPLNPIELHKAMLKANQLRSQRSTVEHVDGDILSIYGARGGLGSTTLAVNLAVRIASVTEQRAALLDLDLQRGDCATFLNLTPVQSISSFAQPSSEYDDMFLQGVLTRHPSNVFVLPAPTDIEEAEMIGRNQVARALTLMRSQFKFTLVDTPRVLTETSMAAFEQSERIFVLTDLTIPGIRSGQRAVDLLTRLDINPEKVQVILTELTRSEIKVDEAAKAIGRVPILTLPRDVVAATEAMNAGTPLDLNRDTPLSHAINELVTKVTGTGPKTEASPLLRRLFGLGRSTNA